MLVAIDNIGKLEATHKVLILGDMFELGDESPAEHAAVIDKAMHTPVNERIFIGSQFYAKKGGTKAVFYQNAEDAITALKAAPINNAVILIKGSRGMALERLTGLF